MFPFSSVNSELAIEYHVYDDDPIMVPYQGDSCAFVEQVIAVLHTSRNRKRKRATVADEPDILGVIDEEESKETCVACMTKPAVVAHWRCSHVVYCLECQEKSTPKCPLCRKVAKCLNNKK